MIEAQLSRLNTLTQPQEQYRVFNQWSVIPEAWYFVMRSADLKKKQVKPFQIMNQRLAVFRTASGEVHAVDAFCPHMGTDLNKGKVVGEHLQCFFHRWEFGGNGLCKKIPSLNEFAREPGVESLPPVTKDSGKDMGLLSYLVCEKYGLIWVYSGPSNQEPKVPVLDVPELEGKEIIYSLDRLNRTQSHYHISMVNGLDAQHLKTVHGLTLEMQIDVKEHEHEMSFVLSGNVPKTTLLDRLMKLFFGPKYSYAMKYSLGSIASLAIFRNVYFLSPKWKWPELYMLYAYRPIAEGVSETQPIYVALRGKSLFDLLKGKFKIFLTRRAYYFLKDEDDKVYDHIRFVSKRFLGIDRTVLRYINYVEQLKPSSWSTRRS